MEEEPKVKQQLERRTKDGEDDDDTHEHERSMRSKHEDRLHRQQKKAEQLP